MQGSDCMLRFYSCKTLVCWPRVGCGSSRTLVGSTVVPVNTLSSRFAMGRIALPISAVMVFLSIFFLATIVLVLGSKMSAVETLTVAFFLFLEFARDRRTWVISSASLLCILPVQAGFLTLSSTSSFIQSTQHLISRCILVFWRNLKLLP